MGLTTIVRRVEAVIDFPCLRRSRSNGQVVLFSGLSEGMVLHPANTLAPDPIGCSSATWVRATDEEAWEPVRSITIEEV